ncbi:MAG: hypothetical protein MK041_13520, partial [Aquabacterium sp.]|nr:hypothetical protein [Aquabacterium sp.]
EVIALDIAQDPHNLAMFTRYAEQYGGTSAAARALMEAELARQSLGPNRTLSDGTAVPLSFESLRTQHARQVNQLAEGSRSPARSTIWRCTSTERARHSP